jgi:hypothetical protein
MALWDQQVSDLRSIGVQFSRAELEGLNDPGGEMRVAHLHPVSDPASPDGTVWYLTDPDGQPHFVVETLTLMHPSAVVMEDCYPRENEKTTLISQVDRRWGVLDAPFPYYLALRDECVDDPRCVEGWYRTEEVHPYPFWSCLPLQGPDQVAAGIRLTAISQRRRDASLFDDIAFICEFEEQNEYCLMADDVWQVCNGYLSIDSDIDQQLWDHSFDEWTDPLEGPKMVAVAFQRLLDANYVDNPIWDDVRRQMNVNDRFRMRPIEDFTSVPDEQALDIWRTLMARRDYIRALLPQYFGAQILNQIDSAERLYEC